MKPRKKRWHSLRDVAAVKRVIREQKKAAKSIITKAKKFARLVERGERDGVDGLKVMDKMLEFQEFMKELAVMTIDFGKYPRGKHVGLA